MKWIDKSNNRVQGNAVVDKLLDEAWNDTDNQYIGADYDGLNVKKYRDNLVPLMLDEQKKTCCYCMKSIDEQVTTIEHLIPQSIKKDEFDNYLVIDELKDHVIHKDDFPRGIKQIPPEKYPHDIGYSNLIASCNSKEHCNNLRGSKEIKPFVFDNGIENKVSYDKAGLIDCEEYADSFEKIGLNTLDIIIIRRIWRKLITNNVNPEELTPEELDLELYSMIDDPNYMKIIQNLTPKQHRELLEFNWFGSYYKTL